MQVDFYIIGASDEHATFRIATRLIEKAHAQGMRVLLLCQDMNMADALDDWLWTFDETSFIPHSLIENIPEGENPPIQIGTHDTSIATPFDILVNLSETAPSLPLPVGRILELVPHHGKAAGRMRYKVYQGMQYDLRKHNV